MCCCGCGSGCSSAIGNGLYIVEKLASFFALTAVVICLILTLFITLGLGVGLGYNYCFVDMKYTKPDSKSLRSGDEVEELEDTTLATQDFRRRFGTTGGPLLQRTLPDIKPTIRIPLKAEIDFTALLSKLRGRNKNVTLELIS